MANIHDKLNKIISAILGKDVRQALYDGLDLINKETEYTTAKQQHLEETFNELVINSGNSNAEIVDARVDKNGGRFEKLGDRLDTFDSHLEQCAKKDDVAKISSGTPLFASSTTEMIDTTKNYVNTTDGYLYIYSNGQWTKTGVLYQSMGIADKSIRPYKTDFINYDDIMSQDGIVVGAINSVGTINSSLTGSNTSDFISVEEGMPIDIPGKIKYLAYYNVNKVSLVSSLGRLSNLNNYTGVIPSNTDKVKYIRITWDNTSGNEYYRNPLTINIFKADKINLLKPFKDNSINLSVIKGIEDLSKNSEDNIYFEYVSQYKTLTIYMKTIAENTYLGYRFKRMTAEYDAGNSSSNYDIWRLRGVGVYTKGGNTFTDILTDGLVHEASEWECAIKETGMPDFSGGSTHGDEFIDSIVFMLDGQTFNDVSLLNGKSGKELRIIRKSKLYRANTNSETYIADHYVDYLFKNNEIIIDNRVDWKVDTNCGISYLCMLGAKRLNGTTQITNKGIKQGDGSVLDVSTEGHSNNTTTKRCTKAYLWNDGANGGVNVNISIEILDNNFFPNFNFKFDNRAEYNKFYFDQCGTNFDVKTGDIWFNKAKYKIDYLGKY